MQPPNMFKYSFQSLQPALNKEYIDIQAAIECRLTLKRVHEMIRTYSQMHRTNKYSRHRSRIRTMLLWV